MTDEPTPEPALEPVFGQVPEPVPSPEELDALKSIDPTHRALIVTLLAAWTMKIEPDDPKPIIASLAEALNMPIDDNLRLSLRMEMLGAHQTGLPERNELQAKAEALGYRLAARLAWLARQAEG
ncbi:MAG TPA: hypothetical protein VFW22_16425 [Pseudolabrys sp.]|nr:hypothetical protein [Pseudolabrys sp.]